MKFKKNINSSRNVSFESNGFSGNVSDTLLALDKKSVSINPQYKSVLSDPETFAFPLKEVSLADKQNKRISPVIEAEGKGIFSHVSEKPIHDYFGNSLNEEKIFLGAGFSSR